MTHLHWWPGELDLTVPRDALVMVGHVEMRMSLARSGLSKAERREWQRVHALGLDKEDTF